MSGIDYYDVSLTTPPLPLIGLLGKPEVHALVGDYFKNGFQLPMNSVGIAELNDAPLLFGEKKPRPPGLPSGVLLKNNWMPKHKLHKVAVALVFIGKEQVTSDPSSFHRLCEGLETIRQASRPHSIRTLLCVVSHGPLPEDIPEDKLAVLRRYADVDAASVISVGLGGSPGQSLDRLARAVRDRAEAYYSGESQRVLQSYSEDMGHERAVRLLFKTAAYAEFRSDFDAALRGYRAAYDRLAQVLPMATQVGQNLRPQSVVAVLSVAEQVHFKLVMLLFHQQRVDLAFEQYARHLELFKGLTRDAPSALIGWHHGWVSRQHAVVAELLSIALAAGMPLEPLAAPETPGPGGISRPSMQAKKTPFKPPQPGELFLAAAWHNTERRIITERVRSSRAASTSARLTLPVGPGPFVGTVVNAASGTALPEDEFIYFLEGEEMSLSHAKRSIELLKRAHELFKSQHRTHSLIRTRALMATEYVTLGEAGHARSLLLSAASDYRRERWDGLLGSVLLQLRECAQRLNLVKEHTALSLELACLETGVEPSVRAVVAETARTALCAEHQIPAPPDEDVGNKPAPEDGPDAPPPPSPMIGHGPGLDFVVGPDSGLLRCLTCVAGFSHPAAWAPGDHFTFAVALRSAMVLPVLEVGVSFSNAAQTRVHTFEEGDMLQPGSWRVVQFEVELGRDLRAAAKAVTLRVGPHATFAWEPVVFGSAAGEAVVAMEHPFNSALRIQPGLAVIEHHHLKLPHTMAIEALWEPPVLEGEDLPVVARLRLGPIPLRYGRLVVDVKGQFADVDSARLVELWEDKDDDAAAVPWRDYREVENLEPGDEASVRLRIRARHAGKALLRAGLVVPRSDGRMHVVCSTSMELNIQTPLSLIASSVSLPTASYMLLPGSRDPGAATVGAVPTGRPCELECQLCANADLDIVSMESKATQGVELRPVLALDGAETITLGKGDIYSPLSRFTVASPARALPLGSMLFSMRRRQHGPPSELVARPVVQQSLALPSVNVEASSIEVQIKRPASVHVGKPFNISIICLNRTQAQLEAEVFVGESGSTVVEGLRSASLSIHPSDSATLTWTLVTYSSSTCLPPDVVLSFKGVDKIFRCPRPPIVVVSEGKKR